MAGAISFSGLGSGIDFSKLTESILATRSRPISLLQNKSADLTKRSDAFKALNTKLATLTAAADALTNKDIGTGRLATSSATDKVTVSADETAGTGTLGVTVTRLATSLTQNSRAYATATTAVLVSPATTATFELRKGGAASGTAITVNSANNTLTGLRDAINAADAGVTASIVDTSGAGTAYKLVLNSSATGAAGRVQLVETTATGTDTDIAFASLNPPGATVDFSDLNSSFSVNGLALTRSTNAITDAVTGLTLNLKATGTSTVTVAASTNEIESGLRNLVNAYNDVQDFFASQYTKGSNGRYTGALAGDVTAQNIQRQLRDALGGSSTTNGGALENLTQLGIGRDANGKLTLNSTTLSDKLTSSLSDVKALLAGADDDDTGIANTIYDTFYSLSDSVAGTVQSVITGYATSIKSLDNSVTDQLSRLTLLKASLTRQFAQVDAAINGLNSQGTTLTSILDSFKSSSKK